MKELAFEDPWPLMAVSYSVCETWLFATGTGRNPVTEHLNWIPKRWA